MAKKLVSVALRKKTTHPFKHTSKRRKLKTALKNIFTYLKSDAYMFAPLLHPQSYPTSAPPSSSGEVSWENRGGERKLVEDVREYLICDSYLYAPLVKDSAALNLGRKAETGSVCEEMAEETTVGEAACSVGCDDRHDRTNRIVVRHNVLQKETVKRVVHQNCRISSAPGYVPTFLGYIFREVLLQKEKRKVVVE